MRNIINHQIDECLLSYENEKDSKKTQGILLPQTLRCRRGVDKDIDTIHQFSSSVAAAAGVDEDYSDSERTSAADHPLHFYILLEEIKLEEKDGKDKDHGHDTKSQSILKGVAMWYFGYSTWQGKVMNVDTLLISRDGSINEKILLDALVTIAKSFSLRRIVYQIQGAKEAELFKEKYGADLLGEWLTLKMGRGEMTSFLNTRGGTWDPDFFQSKTTEHNDNATDSNISVGKGSDIHITGGNNNNISIADINCVIDTTLSKINPSVKKRKRPSNSLSLQLRRAVESDAKSILKLVHGLAVYEKALHEVHVNEEIYKLDGGGDNPMYHCILLEGEVLEGNVKSKTVVGMGFFYFGRFINGGRFLYLEDLFIEKEYRGNGFGKAIMYALAEIAQDLNCQNFVWQALDWNTPALNFYRSIGAAVCDGLITLRFDKERIDDYKFTNVDDRKK